MTTERAVLAGGCVWGVQELFGRYDRVPSTRVGYTGGTIPDATYRNHNGHAEPAEVIYDAACISYRRILKLANRVRVNAAVGHQRALSGGSITSALMFIIHQ